MSNQPLSEMYLEAAEKWTDLESAASLLEETKSAVLSQMMLKLGDMPVSKAELIVKGSEAWALHIDRMVKARTLSNKAKVYLEFLRMKGWENQSRQATERTQARL